MPNNPQSNPQDKRQQPSRPEHDRSQAERSPQGSRQERSSESGQS